MSFFVFLIILVLAYLLLWPHIRVWLFRRLQNRAEDYLRRATGMPPRDDRTDKNRKRRQKEYAYGNGYYQQRDDINVADEMKKVAVDVDFTEVHEYSEDIKISHQGESAHYTVEQQVSDAEYIEIREKKGS